MQRPTRGFGSMYLPCALMLAIWPVLGHCLSVGDIELQSAQSEPLRASVVLRLQPGEDGQRVAAAVGTRQMHQQLGLPYLEIYGTITATAERAGDDWRLVLRSTGSVDATVLNFVLQVAYDEQTILREFTVNLAAGDAGQGRKTAGRQKSGQGGHAAPAHEGEFRLVDGIETYGPTRASDVLGTVGRMFRPDKRVNLNRVMLALFRQNSDAFVDGNINRLQAGYYLQLRDPDDIESISIKEAARQVDAHYRAWRSGKPLPAAPAGNRTSGANAVAKPVKPVKAVKAVKTEGKAGTKAANKPGKARAAVAAASDGNRGARDGSDRQRSDRLVQEELMQKLAANNAASETMRERVEQLQQRLRELQDEYDEKTRQVERLENSRALRAELDVAREAMTAHNALQAANAVDTAPAERPAATDAAVPEISPVATDDAAAASTAPAEAETAEAMPATRAEHAEATVVDKDHEAAAADQKPVATSTESRTEADSDLMPPWMLLALLAGILLSAALALPLLRRMMQREDADDVALPYEEEFEPLPEPVAGARDEANDFAPDEHGEHYHSSSEVMVEAKLAIARGELDVAVNVLKHALVRDSHNEDLRLVLLETLFRTGNAILFGLHANIYADIFGKETVGWLRIADLGRQLAPEMNIFATDADADMAEPEPSETFITDDTTGEDTTDIDTIGTEDDLALMEKVQHSLGEVAADLQLPQEPVVPVDAQAVDAGMSPEIDLQSIDGLDEEDIFSLDDETVADAAEEAPASARKSIRA